jgi:hypothetical protein
VIVFCVCRREQWREGTHHGAGVGRGKAIYECAPDVEVGAASADRVDTAGVAQLCAGVDIVLVDEGETHVLWV